MRLSTFPAAALAPLLLSGLVLLASPSVACDSDLDCPPAAPFCDAGTCIECFLDLDCGPDAPRCDGGTGSCQGCDGDGDCAAYPSAPLCLPSGGCGECSAADPSACVGQTPVCETSTGSCQPCATDNDCIESPDGPVCSTDGSCSADAGTCEAAPRDDCGQPGRALVRVRAAASPARNSVQWRWLGGSAELEDFGDPMTTTDYTVCIYRDDDVVLSGGVERHASRWRWTGNGFRYRHRDDPEGLQRLTLLSGQGRAKLVLRAKGIFLTPVPLPLGGSSVLVQVQRRPSVPGGCWSSEFPAPYSADSARTFRGKIAN